MTNLRTEISQEVPKETLGFNAAIEGAVCQRCSCSVLGRDCRRTLHLEVGRKDEGEQCHLQLVQAQRQR